MAKDFWKPGECMFLAGCAVEGECPLMRAASQKGKGTPYEIHITVKEGDPGEFSELCRTIGIKAVRLDLQKRSGEIIPDLMTSSIHWGDDASVQCESRHLAQTLRFHGYDAVRIKVETVPWHPRALEPLEPGQYFEAHVAVNVTPEQLEKLTEVVKDNGAHLSRNVFKKAVDGTLTYMVTLRSYIDARERFEERVEDLKECIVFCGMSYEKTITEFTLFDTKVDHDSAWMAE